MLFYLPFVCHGVIKCGLPVLISLFLFYQSFLGGYRVDLFVHPTISALCRTTARSSLSWQAVYRCLQHCCLLLYVTSDRYCLKCIAFSVCRIMCPCTCSRLPYFFSSLQLRPTFSSSFLFVFSCLFAEKQSLLLFDISTFSLDLPLMLFNL
jgi:hypothetical protein